MFTKCEPSPGTAVKLLEQHF
uniref:Uncharacterized protein n=1 Tax=Rhizophora mucronata TaxID=61149 RepID=A0A2P2QVB7_RHIMU